MNLLARCNFSLSLSLFLTGKMTKAYQSIYTIMPTDSLSLSFSLVSELALSVALGSVGDRHLMSMPARDCY